MAEYIDREKTYDNLHRFYREVVSQLGEDCDYAKGIAEGLDAIEFADPAADVAPVVHGRWVYVDGESEYFFLCNRCKKKEYWESNYCPNCGAKMDGGSK